jgi:hypothetical protein
MCELQNQIETLELTVAANKNAQIKIPKYKSYRAAISADCSRCGGTGIYSLYHGNCFKCGGNGVQASSEWRKLWPEGSSIDQRHEWEQEVNRRSESTKARAQIKKLKAKQVSQAKSEALAVEFIKANPGLTEALDHLQGTNSKPANILADLNRHLQSRGHLSDAQVNLAFKLQSDTQARAEEAANANPAPEGRNVVKGIIATVKENSWGDLKMLLKCVGGFKVWTTVPSFIATETDLIGREIAIKVTLERSKDDPSFAFGKRPAKA